MTLPNMSQEFADHFSNYISEHMTNTGKPFIQDPWATWPAIGENFEDQVELDEFMSMYEQGLIQPEDI